MERPTFTVMRPGLGELAGRWSFAALSLAAALSVAAALSLFAADPVWAQSRWGWFGVRIRDLSEQEIEDISKRHGLREGFGALIVEVIRETPAEAAGLRPGDVVVAVRNQPVVDTRTLQRAVGGAPIGEPMPVTVLRREQGRQQLQVTVGRMPDPVAAERVGIEFGFLVRDPERQAEPLGWPRTPGAAPSSPPPSGAPSGAPPSAPPAAPDPLASPPGRPSPGAAGPVPTVAVVVPRSRAEAAGLKQGDVLVEINGLEVSTLEAARAALLAATLDAPLRLVVGRDRERVTLLVQSPRAP